MQGHCGYNQTHPDGLVNQGISSMAGAGSGKKTMKDFWLSHVSYSVLLEMEVFIVVNCIPAPPLHIGLSVGMK